jgi:hypothetical protein
MEINVKEHLLVKSQIFQFTLTQVKIQKTEATVDQTKKSFFGIWHSWQAVLKNQRAV